MPLRNKSKKMAGPTFQNLCITLVRLCNSEKTNTYYKECCEMALFFVLLYRARGKEVTNSTIRTLAKSALGTHDLESAYIVFDIPSLSKSYITQYRYAVEPPDFGVDRPIGE